MENTVILTGGGTAGHVTPNLAMLPLLRSDGWNVHYIGSRDGIERELIENGTDVPYHPISSGKLRRYLDLKNLSDPFRVAAGFFQSLKLMRQLKPRVVFSKGGFVGVPVVWAAAVKHIPVIVHESDITPGLANKLAAPVAKRVCTTFPEAAASIGAKGLCTGSPIRPSLYSGNRDKGLSFAGLTGNKPVLLIMGGSLGARAINEAVDACIDRLTECYEVIHLRGKGSLNPELNGKIGYAQYEFISDELPDLMAAADLVLSRAGANAIWEFAALHKPMVLIPLPLSASRGDQILNTKSFVKLGYARELDQEDMTSDSLLNALNEAWADRASMIAAEERDDVRGGLNRLLSEIYKSADFKPAE